VAATENKAAQERQRIKRELLAYLRERIPELHNEGVKGRDARTIAQAEFYQRRKRGS